MNTTAIEALLKEAIPHDLIEVKTHDQIHFEALIVSDLFEGASRIERQRRVYSVLGPLLQSGQIHALALKTLTPTEWKN